MDLDEQIMHLIDIAIAEDIGMGDITSNACIPESDMTTAKLVIKQAGVLAGLPFLARIFQRINAAIHVEVLVPEGSFQKAGTIIAAIFGPARGILSAERVILNFLQHASGVATATAAYVRKVSGFGCAILDTRKTLPGLRALEKYAVRIGGGSNHRFGLDDRFIIKTHHIALLARQGPNPIAAAFSKVKAMHPDLEVEIEIDDAKILDEALQTDAKVIILCNMTPDEAVKCKEKIRKSQKKVYIQSGTITLDTIRAYAEIGVDAISIGELTHSVPALDIGLKM